MTYHIITIGCCMNKSDSERIAGYLEKHKYTLANSVEKADLVIINTCGVRQSAEDRVYGLVAKIKKQNSKIKIILTGCLSLRKDVRVKLKNKVDIWLQITELPKLHFELNKLFAQTKTPANAEVSIRSYSVRSPVNHPVINNITYKKSLSSNLNFKDVEVGGIEPPELRVINQSSHLVTPTSNLLYYNAQNYLNINPKYQSKFSVFVPIGNGCNNFCSYCVVPYARGREMYRPVKDILEEVEKLAKDGYKEIILVAQNVNSYSAKITNYKLQITNKSKIQNPKSKTIKFFNLLRMINNISGNFWIRFITSHPKDVSDELIQTIVECEKVCEHIHLPIQSGDNQILKAMNRKYTVEHYKNLINKIRNKINLFKTKTLANAKDFVRSNLMRKIDCQPIINNIAYIKKLSKNQKDLDQSKIWNLPVSITTDVIVGFPGETKKQFNNTVELFKTVKFDMAYISKYSPRPGTLAEKLKDNVSQTEKKTREKELTKILKKTALENNKKYLNQVVDVLIEGKNRKEKWYGKTRTGKNFRFKILDLRFKNKDLTGQFVKVKITNVEDFGLKGELV